MDAEPFPLSDEAIDAFLGDAVEKDRKIARVESLKSDLEMRLADALDAHGYEPLEPGTTRYGSMVDSIERRMYDEIDHAMDRTQQSPELADTLRAMITLRMNDYGNVEKSLIEFTLMAALRIEHTKVVGDGGRAEEVEREIGEFKREMYAGLIIMNKVKPDNPVVKTMVSFLPGGPLDDDTMAPYFARAIADLPAHEERSRRQNRLQLKAREAIGLGSRSSPLSRDEELDASIQINDLIRHGAKLSSVDGAQREALLYEFARENCPRLTARDVRLVIKLTLGEYPSDPEPR